ncbi:MAG TPA: fibrillarin-like rRNA/tRNA 2'-O-methyltransferase [Thermoplasmataceae archaeon]|nr:fibrillarin-like rRNA/tRNA 2'-O-methyltransferase [Thermoplasmataceae archaeon]
MVAEIKLGESRLSHLNRNYYTVSDYPVSVYGERVSKKKGKYVRYWDPKRSKLSAALNLGLEHFSFRADSNVLYLGASTGTTVSHISDVCYEGRIFAVESSYESFVKLIKLSEGRRNIFPILEDANFVERYVHFLDRIDTIYQDISQRNQVQIFNNNAASCPNASSAILILKMRAISSRLSEKQILNRSLEEIEGFRVKEVINLKPFHKAHYFIYLER